MIGIVLVTHGRLADELVNALQHVVGEEDDIATVCIHSDDDMEQRRRDIIDTIAGVVLLTDMFGGTPSNLAISVMTETNVEVIAGVNLPMLIELAQTRRTSDLAQAVAEAQEAGRKYINIASRLLAERGE